MNNQPQLSQSTGSASHAAADDHSRGPLLTVILPVYNEESTIHRVLSRVLAEDYRMQIVVVDDGSTDGTSEQLALWAKHPSVQVLRHATNRGKGNAIRTALAVADGEFVIIQDADLEYDPADYLFMIQPLRLGQATVVYGSRYLTSKKWLASTRERWLLELGVRLLNMAVWGLFGVRITDEATCYKAMPKALLRSLDLQCERFEFCPEVTAKLCRLKLPILEVPISYHPRTTREGKKLRMRDGLAAVQTLWRWRHWTPATSAPASHEN